MSYEIKVLSSEEFDNLPYDGIGDSLGFADVKRGKVFVRHTGSHELNRYLINHEIDHLVEEHPTDEDEHGIRHKKFFKEFLLPAFTGYNAQQKTWSPLGILDPKNLNPPKHADYMSPEETKLQGQQPKQSSGSPMANFSAGGQPGMQSSGDTNSQSSLNPGQLTGGLNGQSQNISPDILQRIYGYYSGRTTF